MIESSDEIRCEMCVFFSRNNGNFCANVKSENFIETVKKDDKCDNWEAMHESK